MQAWQVEVAKKTAAKILSELPDGDRPCTAIELLDLTTKVAMDPAAFGIQLRKNQRRYLIVYNRLALERLYPEEADFPPFPEQVPAGLNPEPCRFDEGHPVSLFDAEHQDPCALGHE